MKKSGLVWPFAALLGLNVASAADSPRADSGDEPEEVVVTGSRLQASGFNAPTPVTVIGTETIQQRAPANIVDVLTEQPAVRIAVTDSTRNGSGNNSAGLPQTNQATIDLRSLGAARTLTLIDGRRSVGTNWDGTVDTTIVPVGLVDRVDIVTGGASAAYGSDAVAGVVNIVLKHDLEGISASAQTGWTQYAAGKQYTLNIAGGTSFFEHRLHVMAGVDYNKTNAIDDVYGKYWAADEIGNFQPANAYRAANGLPSTVIASGVEPASAAVGGLWVSPSGAAYTFDKNGNPVPFSRGIVSSNSQLMIGSTSNYGHNLNDQNPLRIANTRVDSLGRISFDITDKLHVYGELSDSHSNTPPFLTTEVDQGAGFGNNAPAIAINATNPFVSAATRALVGPGAFQIGRIDTEFGRFGGSGIISEQVYNTLRVTAGLDGSFGNTWKWDASYSSGKTRLDQERNDWSPYALQKAVNGCNTATAPPGTSMAAFLTLINRYEAISGKTCSPFNPFGEGNMSQAALDYVQNDTYQIEHMELDVATASLTGSPFSLPAGDFAVATGVEWRHELLSADSDPVSAAGALPPAGLLNNNLVESFGETTVREGFIEIGAPLLKDKLLAKSLDFNAATRFTDYELSGLVKTWKMGFTWDPVDSLRARLTRSHDIRAPNLRSLFFTGGPNNNNINNHIPIGTVGANGTVNGYTDPAAMNSVLVAGGSGNPALKPEVADTWTGGLVFTKNGFDSSLDFYSIVVNSEIGSPTGQQTVDNCALGAQVYCSFIVFDNPASVPGGISYINPLALNLNKQTIRGWDLESGYTAPLGAGRARVRALVNYQPHNYQLNVLTHQTTENANTLGGQPKLAYNVSLGYDIGRWATDVQVRGFTTRRGNSITYNPDGTVTATTMLGPEDAGYIATRNNTLNKNRWPGQYTVNPSVNLKVNDKVTTYFNIDNLLNVGPPDLATSSVYDLVGRRFRLGIRAAL